jgi:hypothetical protein
MRRNTVGAAGRPPQQQHVERRVRQHHPDRGQAGCDRVREARTVSAREQYDRALFRLEPWGLVARDEDDALGGGGRVARHDHFGLSVSVTLA